MPATPARPPSFAARIALQRAMYSFAGNGRIGSATASSGTSSAVLTQASAFQPTGAVSSFPKRIPRLPCNKAGRRCDMRIGHVDPAGA